jgi:hypothetical protein
MDGSLVGSPFGLGPWPEPIVQRHAPRQLRRRGDGAFLGAAARRAPAADASAASALGSTEACGGERDFQAWIWRCIAAAVSPLGGLMRYQAFQTQSSTCWFPPGSRRGGQRRLSLAPPWLRDVPPLSQMSAGWEMLTRAGLTHHRPRLRHPQRASPARRRAGDRAGGRRTPPFGDLVRFRKEGDPEQPRILLVAPLSGHFATLLRGTVETLLPDNDVYITDWRNARDAPLSSRRVRLRRICRACDRLPGDDRPRRAPDRRLPALRPRPGRRRAHGRGRQSGDAAQHDPDGRAGGHADQPDQGQRAGHQPSDRVVREGADLHGAGPLRRRRAAGLSGLHPADRLHADEPRPARRRPCRHVHHLATGRT